jgi:hypothetical protein
VELYQKFAALSWWTRRAAVVLRAIFGIDRKTVDKMLGGDQFNRNSSPIDAPTPN